MQPARDRELVEKCRRRIAHGAPPEAIISYLCTLTQDPSSGIPQGTIGLVRGLRLIYGLDLAHAVQLLEASPIWPRCAEQKGVDDARPVTQQSQALRRSQVEQHAPPWTRVLTLWRRHAGRARRRATITVPVPPRSATADDWHLFLEQVVDQWSGAHWDRATAERCFVNLVTALEQRLGWPCPYEIGLSLQDMPVHGDMLVPQEVLTEEQYTVRLRASDIGTLITI